MMDNNRIKKLENNIRLKKVIFSKGIWRNYAFIPPSLVLFAGILGLVYLYKIDYLLTMYSIPFIAIFFIGTIWFKATKRHLINKKISENKIFRVCMCIPLIEKDKKHIYMFSIGNNRNNKYYLEKEKRGLLDKSDNTYFFNKKDKITKVLDTDLYILNGNYLKKSMSKKNTQNGQYWVVFFDNERVELLADSMLNRYS